ncbi:UNVERIFIED_CONTAM: hypothetical protein Slati_2651500 [Sesamum latifolium]|uniref:Uncharacterized protein n=1 Tax=Sesamum latifolium TaxID=2727402 RepID=A0AAW2VYV1_9LAMI
MLRRSYQERKEKNTGGMSGEENPTKRGKDSMSRTELKEEAPITVQPWKTPYYRAHTGDPENNKDRDPE